MFKPMEYETSISLTENRPVKIGFNFKAATEATAFELADPAEVVITRIEIFRPSGDWRDHFDNFTDTPQYDLWQEACLEFAIKEDVDSREYDCFDSGDSDY